MWERFLVFSHMFLDTVQLRYTPGIFTDAKGRDLIKELCGQGDSKGDDSSRTPDQTAHPGGTNPPDNAKKTSYWQYC